MATNAIDAFDDAKQYVDSTKNPGMFNMLAGLILLTEQINDMQYELRQLKSGIEDLRKRSPALP